MNSRAPAILDHLASLADTTRSRILLLLDRRELTVSQLCAVMQLPQSTVSRHLKALADAGWVSARAEGTSNVYTMARDLEVAARRLWALVREQVGDTAAAAEDQRRLQAALSERRARVPGVLLVVGRPVGSRPRRAVRRSGSIWRRSPALAQPDWIVGDLGCGTGQVSAALAPFVARVIAVDASAAMLQAARKRLHDADNVDLRRGELEALPIDDAGSISRRMMLVLHHVPEPARAIAEVARVLKPGGRLVLVDMLPHDRESYRQQMGHVWLGFSADASRARCWPMPGSTTSGSCRSHPIRAPRDRGCLPRQP